MGQQTTANAGGPDPSGWIATPSAGHDFATVDIAKIDIPAQRAGLVRRQRLLARLRQAPDIRVISVVGAAGAGKTTLLAQLARAPDALAAWVTADDADNDAKQLLRCIVAAIARHEPLDPAMETNLASPGSAALRVLPRLTNSLRRADRAVTLFIDDVHVITDPHALDVLAVLVERLPPGSMVVMAGRSEPALPLPRWRAAGTLASVDTQDLALDVAEAEHVLKSVGVRARRPEVEEIVEATEGWAAGIYLAALSRLANGREDRPPRLGDDAYILSYVESELLAGLPAEDIAFLERTSILDELTGPLCDAVSGIVGSAERLGRLERRNMLVIALDPAHRRFRYHALLRDALLRRLERSDAAAVDRLHASAAAWLEANGDVPHAVEHALRGNDIDTSARLINASYLAIYRGGGEGMLRRWLDRIGDEAIAADHLLPLVAAWHAVMRGDADDADRWTAVAGAKPQTSRAAAFALLQAVQCRHGVEQMLRDIEVAFTLEPHGGEWRPIIVLTAGIARLLTGEPERADALFREVETFDAARGTSALRMAWAERALHAMEHRDWAVAEDLVRRHRASARAEGVEEYQTSMLGLVAEARLFIRRSDIARARDLLVRAQAIRPKLTKAMPHWAVRCLVELARTQLLVGDTAGARATLQQAEHILHDRPGLGVLVERVAELRQRLDQVAEGPPSFGSLTPAELRVLALLQTHLTFKEIANRLGISPNTAKTESMSLYAKLNATSRSEAVEQAVELGLLESMLPPILPPLITRSRRCADGARRSLL